MDREKFEGEGRGEEFEQALERRAYEVWVSEVSEWIFLLIRHGGICFAVTRGHVLR